MMTDIANRRAFLSSSVRIIGIFDVLILLALSGSWLGLLGRWHWALDLMSHFRWQYLVVCGVAVVWTSWRRRRWAMVIAVATLALNAWMIGRLMIGDGGAVAPEGKLLRVVSLNLMIGNPDKDAVLSYLRSMDADVYFLMEVDEAWGLELEVVRGTHPHGLMAPREDNFGVALLSRVPLKDVRLASLGEWELPSIQARLTYEGKDMILLGTHPMPPIGGMRSGARDDQLLSVAEFVRDMKLPVLVVGDLNATPWSRGMDRVSAEGGLKLSPQAWKPTWKVGTLLAIPIDHALCSAPLGIARKRVGPDVGSDHRPIEVEVYWR